MLQTKTVSPDNLELLKKLQSMEELEGFRLVGGTALALQLGHRFSIDLDFFSYNKDLPENFQAYMNIVGIKIENVFLSNRININSVLNVKKMREIF